MPKHHLTLVGAQVMPVYNGIMYAKPDKVFLLHSKETEEQAKNIKNAIKPSSELVPIEDANSYTKIFIKVKQLFESEKDIEWSVNLTGGTKIMTLATNDATQNIKSFKFVLDQNNSVYNLTANQVDKLPDEVIDLELYFKLINQKILEITPLEDIHHMTHDLGLHTFQYFRFLKNLIYKFNETEIDKSLPFKLKDSYNNSVKWNPEKEILTLIHYDGKFKSKMDFFSHKAIDVFFKFGWFEVYVLQDFFELKIPNKTFWSCKVEYNNNPENPKNEIDIIVNTPRKLFFIECKTKVADFKDIDKFRNVVKNYGGLGAKAFLVTLFKPDANILERCKDNKINVYWYRENDKFTNLNLIDLIETEYNKTNPI